MFTILTKPDCPYCIETKKALKMKGLEFREIEHKTEHDIMEFKSQGFKTFPQVFHNENYIGGNQELQNYLIEKF